MQCSTRGRCKKYLLYKGRKPVSKKEHRRPRRRWKDRPTVLVDFVRIGLECVEWKYVTLRLELLDAVNKLRFL